MTKRVLSTTEVVRVSHLLAEHGTAGVSADGAKRYWSYAKGWSDERIAAEIGPDVSDQPIGRIRRELYGNFPPAAGSGRSAALLAQLAGEVSALRSELQSSARDLAELRERMSALADLHAKLCESLTINRVCSVGHLAGRPPLSAKGASITHIQKGA